MLIYLFHVKMIKQPNVFICIPTKNIRQSTQLSFCGINNNNM